MGVLEEKSLEGSDYVLPEGEPSCWVEIDGVSVYLLRAADGGVHVSIYPVGDEMGEALAWCGSPAGSCF